MKENSWEYDGPSIEETTQRALEELGLERDDVHIEVLEEPQKGFLGIGGKGARIKVELIGEWEVVNREEKETNRNATRDAAETDDFQQEEFVKSPTENTTKPIRTVQDILDIFEIDALVEGKEREDAVIVDIWGDDVALLIGKGGNTLDALQYIVNIGCRKTGEVTKRIIVDAEGYRKRRKAKIERQAEHLAGKAISQNKSISLNPMSSSERKIVHMHLRNYDGVWTESSGEDPDRRVVIHPGKNSST